MDLEKESIQKSFAQIEVEMKNRGFEFSGKEALITYGYDRDQKRFLPTAYRSHDEIVDMYRKKIERGKKYEIELVDVPNVSEEEESVYVFTRQQVQEA